MVKKKTKSKMTDKNLTLLVVTLNVNGLNTWIKKERSEWIFLMIQVCGYKIYFFIFFFRVKGWKLKGETKKRLIKSEKDRKHTNTKRRGGMVTNIRQNRF
jgi:hypothetical protein